MPSALALSDRYRVERELGQGGMATVYLAHDVRHRRSVAVKVLRPELSAALGQERFLKEVELTASLQHPHILPLFDSGSADGLLYYVMPYVEGETLRRRLDRLEALDVDEAVTLARQVASALDHAHRRGVVHRDIKPENVLLADGLAVVADFGIALAVEQARENRLTQVGTSLGTPAYMSPEQIAGEAVDGRSDQYALACMLFEMLTGHPPFHGASAQRTMVDQMVAPVPPLVARHGTVPPHVEEALRRALAKDPTLRFATARELATALGDTTPTGGVATPIQAGLSLVVLPFKNLSPEPDSAYFADGLAEEIITDLSKVRALRVIARSSAVAARATDRPVREICRELRVRYALDGSVRKAADALRISAQLIDSENDTTLWAEKFSGTMADVFALQERISREIVGALRLTLTPEEDRRLATREVSDVRVFECCAMARQEVWRATPDAMKRARTLLEDALRLFGRSAPLLAGLAHVHWQVMNLGIETDESHVERAESLAREALALDPASAGAHYVLGYIRGSRGNLREALAHGHAALASEPANPDVLSLLAFLSAIVGQDDDALRYGGSLVEVDPLSPVSRLGLGFLQYLAGRPEDAIVNLENAHSRSDGAAVFDLFVAFGLFALGRRDDAALAFAQGATREGNFALLAKGFAHALSGDVASTGAAITAELEQWALPDAQYSMHVGEMLTMAGDGPAAMRWLENAADRGLAAYRFLAERDRFLDRLRGDPAFDSLLARVRREWETYGP